MFGIKWDGGIQRTNQANYINRNPLSIVVVLMHGNERRQPFSIIILAHIVSGIVESAPKASTSHTVLRDHLKPNLPCLIRQVKTFIRQLGIL